MPARVLSDTAKSLTPGAELSIALGTERRRRRPDRLRVASGRRRAAYHDPADRGCVPQRAPALPAARPTSAPRSTSAALIDAVKRVSLVAGRNTPIRLGFSDGQVTLEAGNGEEAQASESLEAALSGDDISIGFNPSYLLDGLRRDRRRARAHRDDPAGPSGGVRQHGRAPTAAPDLDFRYLLMPLRMQG